ncbi:MAG TPA: class I SAM-dependent methyltransferase [Acidimicrobiia bacterium]|jgi:SAM-dependent methyltransferase
MRHAAQTGIRARLVQPLATAAVLARSVRRSYGVHPRVCTVCGYEGRFHAYGAPLRFDALCPRCRSVERHRLFALWLCDEGHRFVAADVLHFAPELGVAALVQPYCRTYTTADASAGAADRQLDLERLDLADASYDYVICSHVLEHVADDEQALRELHRITRPGGAAILLVPLVEGWDKTFEDPDVTDPRRRELLFGQSDHVRMYGHDFRDRVCKAGFLLDEYVATEPEVSRHALFRGETIFVAERVS